MFCRSDTLLITLFSISPLWFGFIGAVITVLFGLIFSFFLGIGKKRPFLYDKNQISNLDLKDTRTIDPALVVSSNEILSFRSLTNDATKQTTTEKESGLSKSENPPEQESML